MEELKQLEELQSTLSFIKSRDITPQHNNNSSNDDVSSHRFLANLTLLLVKPCGDLGFQDKLNLVNHFVPKLSVPLLEEASAELCRGESSKQCIENSLLSEIHDRGQCGSLQVCRRDEATVGFDAMKCANSTLEDFCRSYFMFHGLDVNKPQLIFKHLSVLSFTESYIYQLDRWNEKILEIPPKGFNATDYGVEEVNGSWILKFMHVFNSGPFRPLAAILESHGLLTDRMKDEFRQGEEYWALERKLCVSSKNKTKVIVEDVMRAVHLKSFDYRVLNLLLYQLRGEEVNELHMEFLSISEFLVEVSDDLFDYEDDVLENNFNILRMFALIYGATTAPAVLAKYITEAEEKYQCLLKILDLQLAQDYQKRCEEATREGGKKSGNPLGTWNIPSVIADEESYRLQFNPT